MFALVLEVKGPRVISQVEGRELELTFSSLNLTCEV